MGQASWQRLLSRPDELLLTAGHTHQLPQLHIQDRGQPSRSLTMELKMIPLL